MHWRWPWLRVEVRGGSMIPTLRPGEWLFVRRDVPPRPGAVMVVRQAGRQVVKRVVRVDENGVWVEGDNAGASDDSRTYGPVDPKDVIGEARFIYGPAGPLYRRVR